MVPQPLALAEPYYFENPVLCDDEFINKCNEEILKLEHQAKIKKLLDLKQQQRLIRENAVINRVEKAHRGVDEMKKRRNQKNKKGAGRGDKLGFRGREEGRIVHAGPGALQRGQGPPRLEDMNFFESDDGGRDEGISQRSQNSTRLRNQRGSPNRPRDRGSARLSDQVEQEFEEFEMGEDGAGEHPGGSPPGPYDNQIVQDNRNGGDKPGAAGGGDGGVEDSYRDGSVYPVNDDPFPIEGDQTIDW